MEKRKKSTGVTNNLCPYLPPPNPEGGSLGDSAFLQAARDKCQVSD